jgi:hypothetical protein
MENQMKAKTHYSDLEGAASADISDFIASNNHLQDLCETFNLDRKKYKILGVTISGTKDLLGSLICLDNEKSTSEREYIVKFELHNVEEPIIDFLFKQFEVILFSREAKHYEVNDYNETIMLDIKSDYDFEN